MCGESLERDVGWYQVEFVSSKWISHGVCWLGHRARLALLDLKHVQQLGNLLSFKMCSLVECMHPLWNVSSHVIQPSKAGRWQEGEESVHSNTGEAWLWGKQEGRRLALNSYHDRSEITIMVQLL